MVVALAGGAPAGAGRCKQSGKVIFREEREPLAPVPEGEPAPVPRVTIEVRASGLGKRDLVEVKRAIKRAPRACAAACSR